MVQAHRGDLARPSDCVWAFLGQGEKKEKKRKGEGERQKVIAIASFEKHEGSFELNVLVLMPLGFVVVREAELASKLQVGVWNEEDVPTVLHTPNLCACLCSHKTIILHHIC